MKPTLPSSSIRLLLAALWMVLVGVCTGWAAAPTATETGARLLQAQLPNGTSLEQLSCESLARAVGRATLAHRPEAAAILSAALTRRNKVPCACVIRVFRVSLSAAPAQASTLLETASALYPDCAEALTAALDEANDKDVADDKNVVAASNASNAPHEANFDPNVRGFGDEAPDDLSDRDTSGLGFGGGFGPGFPGSPGFIGSPASGGLALPSPIAVTSVVNG